MEKIYLLTDYKGHFGSKHDDVPYRSGMELHKLKAAFSDYGYDAETVPFSMVHPGDGTWAGKRVLYTSTEDPGLIYKQYIEDVVLALSYAGAEVIPRFEFLRANNNKVFMELMRELVPENLKGNITSSHFGTLEEMLTMKEKFSYPVVVKGHSGAMGRNVFLAHNAKELQKTVRRKVVPLSPMKLRIKEYLRQVKHRGYQRDSFSRGRFIVQEFIPGLTNDWKVYFFGERAFVFYRPVFPERIFKASGGGYDNYRYGEDAEAPPGMLDFGWEVFRKLNVPNASLDIAWDGSRFYLLEFQCIYFGTAGILRRYSRSYFQKTEKGWRVVENEGGVEKVYAGSIAWFINIPG